MRRKTILLFVVTLFILAYTLMFMVSWKAAAAFFIFAWLHGAAISAQDQRIKELERDDD